MKKRCILIILMCVLSIVFSLSFATKNTTHSMSLYLGEKINIKDYISKEGIDFEWTSEVVVQNMNASVVSVNSIYIMTTQNIGNSVLILSSDDQKLVLEINITTPVESVSLEHEYLALLLGEIHHLNYSVTTKNGFNTNDEFLLQWVSSNPNIASISNGSRVITKAVGSVTITGKTPDGTVVASFELSVLGHSNNVIIKSNNRIRDLNVGETLALIATFGTKNITESVEWISLTPHILEVDENGLIIAIGEGRGEVKAQSSVRNKNATYEVSSHSMIDHIELNNTVVAFKGIGQTHQLSFNLYPKDKSYPPILKGYEYKTSNERVATVSVNGLVTAKGPGIALISVVFEDSQKRAVCTVEVADNDVIPVANYIAVKSIELAHYQGTALIGEKILLEYKIIPENASDQNVTFNIPYGDNSQIEMMNGAYYFIPEKRGTIKIEVVDADGNTDVLSISVTSPIESMKLSLSTRHITGTNEEQLYIGEKAELLTRIYTKSTFTTEDVYKSSLKYSVKNENIASIAVEGNRYYVQGLKNGKTEITVENLEGKHMTTLWINVEDPVISVATDHKVVLPMNKVYRPRINTSLISMSRPISSSFDIYNRVKLSVEKLYLKEIFIEEEINYEKKAISSYDNIAYNLVTRDKIDNHEARLEQLLRYQNNIINGYVLLQNSDEIKDRNGRTYDFYSISDAKIVSSYPVKALVKIEIEGTIRAVETTLIWQGDNDIFNVTRLNAIYDVSILLSQYGIQGTLETREKKEQVELLMTYINNRELFEKTPTYSVLRALSDIEKDGMFLPVIKALDQHVMKEDLAQLSMILHQKYIDRYLTFDNLTKDYYYDVIDNKLKDAISLNYVNPLDELNFGTGERIILQDYNSMLNRIIPLYQSSSSSSTTPLTFESLVLELGKLIK